MWIIIFAKFTANCEYSFYLAAVWILIRTWSWTSLIKIPIYEYMTIQFHSVLVWTSHANLFLLFELILSFTDLLYIVLSKCKLRRMMVLLMLVDLTLIFVAHLEFLLNDFQVNKWLFDQLQTREQQFVVFFHFTTAHWPYVSLMLIDSGISISNDTSKCTLPINTKTNCSILNDLCLEIPFLPFYDDPFLNCFIVLNSIRNLGFSLKLLILFPKELNFLFVISTATCEFINWIKDITNWKLF